MVSTADLNHLYGELRAKVLARHFALGRYFRTTYLTESTALAATPAGKPTVDESTALLDAVKNSDIARWAVLDHQRENPLAWTGQLMMVLAIEHHFGRQDALPAIRLAVATLGGLFRFSGNHFEGYPLRWDPVRSDSWAVQPPPVRRPTYCRDFLLGADRRYRYCVPFEDPAYSYLGLEAGAPGHWAAVSQYRHLEPSMDELVWMLVGYDYVYRLVADPGVRAEVRRQLLALTDYLAEYAYLLVRPAGGFTARGAGGVNPAMEYVFNRVVERDLGLEGGQPIRTHVGRDGIDATFEAVLRKAGVWPAFAEAYRDANLAVSGAAALLALAPLLDPFGLTSPLAATLEPLLVAGGPQVARALVFHERRRFFDVQNDRYQGEFAAAYLLLQVADAVTRFHLFTTGAGLIGSHGVKFAIAAGLVGYADTDATLRDAYLSWLHTRRLHDRPDLAPPEPSAGYSAEAIAAGVLLGDDSARDQAVELLQRFHPYFAGGDLPVDQRFGSDDDRYDGSIPLLRGSYPVTEDATVALRYMTVMAAAWLCREQSDGAPADGFPDLPDVTAWADPVIPPDVLTALDQRGEPILQRPGSQLPPGTPVSRPVPLLAAPLPASSPEPIPDPVFDPTVEEEALIHAVTCHLGRWTDPDGTPRTAGLDADAPTGVAVLPGQDYEIRVMDGRLTVDGEAVDPNGERDVAWDAGYPLTGVTDPRYARRYAVLGRFDQHLADADDRPHTYFHVGRCRQRAGLLCWDADDGAAPGGPSHPYPLSLRVNIPAEHADAADGHVVCQVRVWAVPRRSLVQSVARVMDPVEPPVGLRALAERHRWVRPPDRLSTRDLLARHHTASAERVRLLVLDADLLGVDIPIEKYVRDALDVEELLLALAIDPLDALQTATRLVTDWGQRLLDAYGIDPLRALQIVGVLPMDPVSALLAVPDGLRHLIRLVAERTGSDELDLLYRLTPDPAELLRSIPDVVRAILDYADTSAKKTYLALILLGVPLPPVWPPPPFAKEADYLRALKQYSDIVEALLTWLGKSPLEMLQALRQHVLDKIDPADWLARIPGIVDTLLTILPLKPGEVLGAAFAALGAIDPRIGDVLDDMIGRFVRVDLPTLLARLFVRGPMDALRTLAPDKLELLHALGIDLPTITLPLTRDPVGRATALGDILPRDYDLAALYGVGSQHLADTTLQVWAGKPTELQPPVPGPRPAATLLDVPPPLLPAQIFSSGLLVAGVNRRITDGDSRVFDSHYEWKVGGADLAWLVDADRWMCRGVLLTRVGMAGGWVDLYVTQLYRGGMNREIETTWPFSEMEWPDDADRTRIRLAQLDEVIDFVRRTHRPQNVAVLVGDLGIDARDPAAYTEVTTRLARIDLIDAWPGQHGGAAGCTTGDLPTLTGVRQPDDPRYCLDPGAPAPDGRRVDYLFVEQPTPQHTVRLDLTRTRRRILDRPDHPSEHLSCHLGLDVTVIASPANR